jgi:glycosyltransferase involved in cell wall biosynthesis/peptidoglycan/xylan/chitin deacetylase (PgdA/CDA1 family)
MSAETTRSSRARGGRPTAGKRDQMSTLNPWLRLQRFYQRRAASLLFKRPLLIRQQRPLISFTFDDFPRSALLAGGVILNRFGFAGTYYASLGLMGEQAPTGQLFLSSDLTTLVDRGHELGCHTFSHLDSWDTETSTFENSIIENRVALNRLLPGAEFKSFSYPISLPRPLTKAKTAEHFLCCRGGGQTLNAGKADLNQLAAYFLEKSRHNIQAIKDLIDQNRKVHGWLIFATHDISDDPTPYGCTPEFFEQVVQYAASSGAHIMPVVKALEVLGVPGYPQESIHPRSIGFPATIIRQQVPAKPLVSILIPAFNAQEWISDTLRSAIAQTWDRKEIIVVDDGSTDQTVMTARQFESEGVRVVSQKNQGAAAARNTALSLSHGDYIQWLDADDLIAPDKIARQIDVSAVCRSKRTLLSSAFGKFLYRWYRAEFVPTDLWSDLSPTEWLLRKMGENLYMQTATWLVSRELTEAAGPWDTRLLSDDDGEYFCRVLLASDGVRFVPDAKSYYRAPGAAFGGSLSYIGQSDKKIKAHWLSMQLHIKYLRSLEDSERVRAACVRYLRTSLIYFYPEDRDIVQQAKQIAKELGGELKAPSLSWKYSWVRVILGWSLAKRVALFSRKTRWTSQKIWDEALFRIENRKPIGQSGDTRTKVKTSSAKPLVRRF